MAGWISQGTQQPSFGIEPWPGAFTLLNGKKLIVHAMEIVSGARRPNIAAEPGLLLIDQNDMLVGCAQGTWLALIELQIEGKKRMTSAEFLRGTQLTPGTRLGH